jgi:hypothetical protein
LGSLGIVFFAIAAGFTASGIVACLYRLSGHASESTRGKLIRTAVLVFAGPTVLFETALRGRATKEWSPIMFWFVLTGLGYWALGLGLLILDVAARL